MAVLAVACSACSGSSRASAVREPGATSLGPGGAASGSASPSPGTVYVLAARSGRVLWSRHLANPVPSRDLPCGDISPVVGITGTPVIDLARQEIFVDADTLIKGPSSSGGVEASHRLFGLDLLTGKVELSQPAMPSAGEDQLAQLQRPGLTLDHGRVVIAYGQNTGDCPGRNGPAHGYVVSIPETGGPLDYFQISSGSDRGAVWMGGSSPVVDPQGNVYVASADGYDLGVGGGIVAGGDEVGTDGYDVAIPYDDRAEWASATGADVLGGQVDGLLHEDWVSRHEVTYP